MAPRGETRIQLCGRLVVRLEGRRVDDALPGALGQLLFAYLVLNRLRRTDRDELLIAVYGVEATPGHQARLSVLLSSGADARVTNAGQRRAVVCVNGGTAREVAGTWSATLEWLVRRLAPDFPRLTFVEVRYRVKSWKQLPLCIDDCRAALAAAVDGGAEEIALLGFSMGGAVSVGVADEPAVRGVVGLAPWIPDELSVDALHGKRLAVFHGALDRWLPGIPGVSARHSREARGAVTHHRGESAGDAPAGNGDGVPAARREGAGLRTAVEQQIGTGAGGGCG